MWFFLIGLSTLLVWQHHVVDVFTGFVLGGFCLLLFPEPTVHAEVQPNRRVAAYYAAGAAATLALGWCFRPWGVLALWPVLALGGMAAANLRLGASIFGKREGRLPLRTRVAFAPILVGQWLSLRHYRRQCRPWDKIAPGVWIGRVLDEAEARDAMSRGVTAVLDLTAEFSEARVVRERTRYLNLPILDLTAPSPDQLRAMAEFIEREAARGIVYVHCKIGYSRSAAAVGAWLLASGRTKSLDDTLAALRQARPSIVVRPEVREALAQFATRQAVPEVVS